MTWNIVSTDHLIYVQQLLINYVFLFVRYMALGIALRYVLEALKKSHNTKMYIFGIAALDRFKTR